MQVSSLFRQLVEEFAGEGEVLDVGNIDVVGMIWSTSTGRSRRVVIIHLGDMTDREL